MSDSVAEDDDMIQISPMTIDQLEGREALDADSSEEENARTPSLTPNAMN